MTTLHRIVLHLLCLAMGAGLTVIAYEITRMPAKRKAGWRIIDAWSYRVGDYMVTGVSVETRRKLK